MPFAAFLHTSRKVTRQIHQGKGIDLKHLVNVFISNLVKSLKNPVTSVVNQDINLAIAEIKISYQSF
ncbi:Uncharacterised protein [Streptococcus pneumoniae]|nr:Uncharacterised protein [Streptococcus pneumoniae]